MANYPLTRITPTTVGRERTPNLWRNVLEQYGSDPCTGANRSDDFHRARAQTVDTHVDGWYVSEDGAAGAAAESFDTSGNPDGIVSLIATTDTDHECVKAQGAVSATVSEGVVLPTNTNGKGVVVFEARVYLDTAANDTCFVGLAEADAALLSTTSVLQDDLDYIGFYRLDGGDLQFVVRNDNNGGTAVEYEVDVVASADVTEDAYVKLGFRVNHDNSVEVYVNGEQVKKTSDTSATIAVPSTALPIERLGRTLLVGRGVTNDNATVSLSCDYIDCHVAE